MHHFLDFTQVELDINVTKKTCQIVLTKLKYQVERTFISVVWRCCKLKKKIGLFVEKYDNFNRKTNGV